MGKGQSQWKLNNGPRTVTVDVKPWAKDSTSGSKTRGQVQSQWKLNNGPRTITVEVKQWAKDSHSGS